MTQKSPFQAMRARLEAVIAEGERHHLSGVWYSGMIRATLALALPDGEERQAGMAELEAHYEADKANRTKIMETLGNGADEQAWAPGEHWVEAARRAIRFYRMWLSTPSSGPDHTPLIHPHNGLCIRCDMPFASHVPSRPLPEGPEAEAALEDMRARKDAAYEERNRVVAALARLFQSGTVHTDIPAWDAQWHGCVYIDSPVGQLSWHYHDSQAHLFAGLPSYAGAWDGHTTEEKYRRLEKLAAPAPDPARGEDRDETLIALRAELRSEIDRADQNYLRACSAESKLERAPAPPSREAVLLKLNHAFEAHTEPHGCLIGGLAACHYQHGLGPCCGKPASAHTTTPVKAKCSPVKIATGTICGEHHAIWPCPAATPGEGK